MKLQVRVRAPECVFGFANKCPVRSEDWLHYVDLARRFIAAYRDPVNAHALS
jgi:hypothetical protein